VLVHGRLALAYSARCFTARRFNVQKDVCGFRCIDHPDGLPVRTREGADFLVLNGIQTQSAHVHSLFEELPRLAAIGVDLVRVSPQSQGTAEVLGSIRAAIDALAAGATSVPGKLPAGTLPGGACNGFWHSRPGLEQVMARGAAT